jgi:hypothetical protein
MRIQGCFGEYGAPWVPVKLRRKECEKVLDVQFLIDTGAYRSMVGTAEIYALGVSIHELRKSVGTAVGFGGRTQFYFLQNVELTFESDQGPHTEVLAKMLTTFGPSTGQHRKRPHVRSVLGRDILDRYALILDKRAGIVVLTDEDLTGQAGLEHLLVRPRAEES